MKYLLAVLAGYVFIVVFWKRFMDLVEPPPPRKNHEERN